MYPLGAAAGYQPPGDAAADAGVDGILVRRHEDAVDQLQGAGQGRLVRGPRLLIQKGVQRDDPGKHLLNGSMVVRSGV